MKAKRMLKGWLLVDRKTGNANLDKEGNPLLCSTRAKARGWKLGTEAVRRAWLQWESAK